MSYTVLARKWRPDHFDEVVGQGHVAQTLVNSIEQDRVAHAYLFCGARGVGKTSTARILAKAMNCEEGPTARPCYECSSCEEISNGQSVDVFEIDGASNRGINEIRELREGVRYAPSRDRYKIYIIDEVHMLTTEAFNALLKTLEEPPDHAIFIFATTEPQKIPVTILSRCQRFDFKRISQRDIVEHLEELCEAEGFDAERSALQIIARQANGGMRDALSLLDQIISFSGERITEREISEILGVAKRKHLFELSDAVLDRDAERALVVLDEINRYGYDLQQFASELVTHFRDLMVTATVDEPGKVTRMTESELEMAREQVAGKPSELLHRYFSVMVDGAQEMSRSGYPKLIFEMTMVRLSELEPMENLDLLVDRLELLEDTLEGDAADVDWPDGVGGGGSRSPEKAGEMPESGDDSGVGSSPEPDGGPPGKPKARTDDSVRAVDDTPESSDEASGQSEEPQTSSGPSRTPQKSQTAAQTVEQPDSAGLDPDSAPESDPGASQAEETTEATEGTAEATEETTEATQGTGGPQPPPIDAYDNTTGTSTETVAPSAGAETAVATRESDTAGETADSATDDEPVPEIPEPLSPSERDEIEVPEVDDLDDPEARWETVVEFMRQVSAPVAATCEHAYLERFDDGVVGLRFPAEFIDFARDDERLEVLHDAVHRVFGDNWSVELELEDEEAPTDGKTLAQKRREDIERRRAEFEKRLRHSDPVEKARELFDADEARVSVRLYDE